MDATASDTGENPESEWRPATLDEARLRIDGIDDAMLALLVQRAQVVRQVARLKAEAGAASAVNAFRPAREVQMLRRLRANVQLPLSEAAVFPIWREIVAAFTAAQAPLEIVLTGEDQRMLVRDTFGASARIEIRSGIREMLDTLSAAPGKLGIVAADADGWWTGLAQHPAKVLCALPLYGTTVEAYCIGTSPIEASGDDVTLVSAAGSGLPSDDARVLARSGGLDLVALHGFFVAETGAASAAAAEALALPAESVHLIGVYPTPILRETM